MARRAARADSPRQGTHPVLIVFLVFSILLALVLGVLYYLERDKTKQARDAEQRLRGELDANNKRLDMLQNWLLVTALSWATTDNEAIKEGDFAEACRRLVEYLNTPPDNRPKDIPEPFIKALDILVGTQEKPGVLYPYGILQGNRLEPFKQKAGAPSLVKKLEEAQAKAADAEKRRSDLEAELKRVQASYDQYKASWNENRLKEELAKRDEEHKKELVQKEQEWEARLKSLQAKLQSVHQDLEKKIKELQASADEKEKKLLEEMNKRIADMEAELQRMRLAARPRLDLSRAIQPSGRVLAVNAACDTVILDRGQKHRLPEGISFSVYPRGPDGRLVPKIKAMVQVVKVNHDTAVARVTRMVKPEENRDPSWDEFDERYWITDPSRFVLLRDPIRPGDFVYNSAWKPNEPVHIALAGIIDIDGDGRDDAEIFKRLLQERGVIIDLHLRYTGTEYVQEGRLTARTDMLVVGINPGVRVVRKPEGEEGKPVVEKDAFEQLEAEARRRGMDVIGVRQFLLQMGFWDLRALVQGGLREAPVPAKKPEGKPEGQ
jgi:hypothetical protein